MVMLHFYRRPLPPDFEEPGLPKRAESSGANNFLLNRSNDDVDLPSRREPNAVDAFQSIPNNFVSGTSRSVHGYGYSTYGRSGEDEEDDDRDEYRRDSDDDLMDYYHYEVDDGDDEGDDEEGYEADDEDEKDEADADEGDEGDDEKEDDDDEDEDEEAGEDEGDEGDDEKEEDDDDEDEDGDDEGGDEDDDDPMGHINEDPDNHYRHPQQHDDSDDSDVVDSDIEELFRDGGVEGDEAEEWEGFGEIDEGGGSEDSGHILDEFRFHTAAELESYRNKEDIATSLDTTCAVCLERQIAIQFKSCLHAACGPCTEGQWYTQSQTDGRYSNFIKCHLCRAEVTIVGDLSREQPVGESAESFTHGISVLTVFKWKTLLSWIAGRREDVAEVFAYGALDREPEHIDADDFGSIEIE